jgi:hypothetical protein
MAEVRYERESTALLVVDPYNDFISEGGKIWDRIRAVAEANDCVPHMLQVLNAARQFRAEFKPKAGEIVVTGFAAQEAWHPSANRHRTHRAHLHRGDRALRR